MEKDIRWKQRFDNYKSALDLLSKSVGRNDYTELEELGLIQCFEYTFELSWNTLKDYLEHQGYVELRGARDVIRKAFEVGLINDGEQWILTLTNRNRTSHTYNKQTAKEVLEFIHSTALKLFVDLKNELQKTENS